MLLLTLELDAFQVSSVTKLIFIIWRNELVDYVTWALQKSLTVWLQQFKYYLFKKGDTSFEDLYNSGTVSEYEATWAFCFRVDCGRTSLSLQRENGAVFITSPPSINQKYLPFTTALLIMYSLPLICRRRVSIWATSSCSSFFRISNLASYNSSWVS